MPAETEDCAIDSGFVTGPYDEGLDLNDLPEPPWTPESLGREMFDKLAIVSGSGDRAMKQIGLSLDPREFGRCRAKRLIKLTSAAGAEADVLMEEGRRLQALIDATLPPPAGTPRRPGAPPLRPSQTVRRTRIF